MAKAIILAVALLALAAGQASAKSWNKMPLSWVYVNETGLVDITSIRVKGANLTEFIAVESKSKYATAGLVDDDTFQVNRTSKWGKAKSFSKSKVLVEYAANNTANGTTVGYVMVVFPKSGWKGKAASAGSPSWYAYSTFYKVVVPSYNGTATVTIDDLNNSTKAGKGKSKGNWSRYTPVLAEFTSVELTGWKNGNAALLFNSTVNPTAFAIVAGPCTGKKCGKWAKKGSMYTVEFEAIDEDGEEVDGYAWVGTYRA